MYFREADGDSANLSMREAFLVRHRSTDQISASDQPFGGQMVNQYRAHVFADDKNQGYVQLCEMLPPALIKDVPQGDIVFSTKELNVPESRIKLVEPMFYEVVKSDYGRYTESDDSGFGGGFGGGFG